MGRLLWISHIDDLLPSTRQTVRKTLTVTLYNLLPGCAPVLEVLQQRLINEMGQYIILLKNICFHCVSDATLYVYFYPFYIPFPGIMYSYFC